MTNMFKFLIFLIALVFISAVYLTWKDGFKPGLWILLAGLVFAFLYHREINKPK